MLKLNFFPLVTTGSVVTYERTDKYFLCCYEYKCWTTKAGLIVMLRGPLLKLHCQLK